MKNRLTHSTSLRLLFAALLPAAIQGCSTFGWLTDHDGNYIDYTTDHLKTAPEPELSPALPGRMNNDQMEFDVYASAGLGVSLLQPDTSAVDGTSVNDEIAGAGQATLGVDLNKHLSLELHSADLGSAGLSPNGRINYHVNGLSALYYAGKNRHNYGRRGITAYGRLGVAQLENTSIGNVVYDRANDTQMLFGAGLEYNTRWGVGLRAELMSFDQDAQFGQMGLIYRFGKQKPFPSIAQAAPLPPPPAAEPAPLPVFVAKPKPVILPKPIIAAAIAPKDSDRDGVFDQDDQCPATAAFTTVDVTGCPLFSGTLEGVNFHTNSADLTDVARRALSSVSRTLMQYPKANILVAAHTDSDGDPQRNQQLSSDRARAVVAYLAQQGIPYTRMSARAYGERQPTDTNSTPEGRANNRRVELFATQYPVQ